MEYAANFTNLFFTGSSCQTIRIFAPSYSNTLNLTVDNGLGTQAYAFQALPGQPFCNLSGCGHYYAQLNSGNPAAAADVVCFAGPNTVKDCLASLGVGQANPIGVALNPAGSGVIAVQESGASPTIAWDVATNSGGDCTGGATCTTHVGDYACVGATAGSSVLPQSASTTPANDHPCAQGRQVGTVNIGATAASGTIQILPH